MNKKYFPPKIIRKWTHDIPDGELYELFVFDDSTVCSTSGRNAHSSGSSLCSWDEFLAGELHEAITRTIGLEALQEAIKFVLDQTKNPSG